MGLKLVDIRRIDYLTLSRTGPAQGPGRYFVNGRTTGCGCCSDEIDAYHVQTADELRRYTTAWVDQLRAELAKAEALDALARTLTDDDLATDDDEDDDDNDGD